MPKKAIQQSVADANAAPGGAAAVDRALSILGSFSATHSTLTLAEIAERTMLYKSSRRPKAATPWVRKSRACMVSIPHRFRLTRW